MRPAFRRRVGEHFRVDASGQDRVDGDAVRPQLLCKAIGQPEQRRLGRAVVYAVRGAVERRLRREVDDASVFAAFFEIRRRCAAGIERAVQIDAHDARPVLIGNILDQRLREHARAVHQNVDAAQRLRGLRHKPVNIGGNGDIRLYRDAAAPHRGDLFPELLRLYGAFPVCQRDVRAVFCQQQADLPADASGAACYNCFASFQ